MINDNIEQYDDEKLKQIIANNLIKYRKHAKLTQLEFAEKLLYSDKNVSRWERAEATPDIFVLQKIADLYGISVNDLLEERDGFAENTSNHHRKQRTKFMNKKEFLITMMSVFCVWLVATIGFFVIESFIPAWQTKGWYCFIIALPFSMIVTLVFTSIWCTNRLNAIVVSLLIWCIATAIYICIPYENNWLIFILAIPVQILDILWFALRKLNYNLKLNQSQIDALKAKKEARKEQKLQKKQEKLEKKQKKSLNNERKH